MANWVTHLMIADEILLSCPHLDARGFSAGSIAPDCNVENEDWTSFTPSREVTHWMDGTIKDEDDCERFRDRYFLARKKEIDSKEEYAFMLGYYAHLIEDAEYMQFLRNPARVQNAWARIEKSEEFRQEAEKYEKTWSGLKSLMGKERRMKEVYAIEREYLLAHPESGYNKYILPMKSFPDYIDYLPKNAIVRKIGVMGALPEAEKTPVSLISMTKEELYSFVKDTSLKVQKRIREAEALFEKTDI